MSDRQRPTSNDRLASCMGLYDRHLKGEEIGMEMER